MATKKKASPSRAKPNIANIHVLPATGDAAVDDALRALLPLPGQGMTTTREALDAVERLASDRRDVVVRALRERVEEIAAAITPVPKSVSGNAAANHDGNVEVWLRVLRLVFDALTPHHDRGAEAAMLKLAEKHAEHRVRLAAARALIGERPGHPPWQIDATRRASAETRVAIVALAAKTKNDVLLQHIATLARER